MRRDAKWELQRLETALLAEEKAASEELPEGRDTVRELSCQHINYKAYNTDKSDEDLERYSEAVRNPPKNRRGLAVLLLLCALAAVWALLKYWGIL